MKKIFYLVIPLTALLTSCASWHVISYDTNRQPDYNNNPAPGNNNQQIDYNQPQTDQVFYDELSPYGQWIDYPDYGYVWQPNVNGDFRPYASNGNWVYTDYGWTWNSNYSWGWAPFHYGRWFYDDNYGWLWQPGHEWAPAWVTWGQSGDYYGWAPIPPRVQYAAVSYYQPPRNNWNFVSNGDINRVNVNNYVVRNNVTVNNNITNNVTIINNVTNNNTYVGHRGAVNDQPANTANNDVNTRHGNGNNVVYNRGPRVTDVENSTNTQITPVRIMGNTRPGAALLTGGQLKMYRPAINAATNQQTNTTPPVPRRVQPFNPATIPSRLQNHQNTVPQVNPSPAQNQNTDQRPNYQPNPRPQVSPAPAPNSNYQSNPRLQVNPSPAQNQNSDQRPNYQPNPRPQVSPAPAPNPNYQSNPRLQVNPSPVQNTNSDQRPNYQSNPRTQVSPAPVQNINTRPQINNAPKPDAAATVQTQQKAPVPVKKIMPKKRPVIQKTTPRPEVDKQ